MTTTNKRPAAWDHQPTVLDELNANYEEYVDLLRQTLDLLDDPNASEFDAEILAWKIRTALSLAPVDEMLNRIYGGAA